MEYFKKNIEAVPNHIPILVIANFRDVQDQWKISSSQIRALVEEFESVPPADKENAEPDKKDAESLPADNSNPASDANGNANVESASTSIPTETAKEDPEPKVSDCFMGVAGDFLHRRRMIKFIETSFLEKFGLHVRSSQYNDF